MLYIKKYIQSFFVLIDVPKESSSVIKVKQAQFVMNSNYTSQSEIRVTCAESLTGEPCLIDILKP